jgi:hypothetical protein
MNEIQRGAIGQLMVLHHMSEIDVLENTFGMEHKSSLDGLDNFEIQRVIRMFIDIMPYDRPCPNRQTDDPLAPCCFRPIGELEWLYSPEEEKNLWCHYCFSKGPNVPSKEPEKKSIVKRMLDLFR